MTKNDKSIQTVLKEQTDFLLSINGVFGVAEGRTKSNTPCILIQVTEITDEILKIIPDNIDQFPVEILETDQPIQF